MSDNQLIAVKSTNFKSIDLNVKKNLKKLKQQLIVVRECLVEKDKIIEGLRLDLAHLVEQLPKLKENHDSKGSIKM